MAYNHEQYLREAIESFLMQETTFPVEILIHEDASTDSTPAIVAEYAARYPKLIRAIIQRVNQYSRGNRPLQLMGQMSRGKYVAICEGDDYWTSEAKLQIQFEMLEARPDASACVHRADGLHGVGEHNRSLANTVRRKSSPSTELIIGFRGKFCPNGVT